MLFKIEVQKMVSVTLTSPCSLLPAILSSPLLGSAGLTAGSGFISAGLLALGLSGDDLGVFTGSAKVGFLPSWSWLVNFSCCWKGGNIERESHSQIQNSVIKYFFLK